MSRKAKQMVCNAGMLQQLEGLIHNKNSEARLVERAKMVLACLRGRPLQETALGLKTSINTVTAWRNRFVQSGLFGLMDMPRSGRPLHYNTEFRTTVLQLLEQPPPKGCSHWSGVAIAKTLQVSDDAVSRLLRKEGIRLNRQRQVAKIVAVTIARTPPPHDSEIL
ncbi:MAG: helix-turn-helix domain-containing protein [Magnetococcus sp. MYC-9]